MAKSKYDTVSGGQMPSSKYKVTHHYAELGDLASPSFLGSEGVGQEKFDKGVRPEDVKYLDELRGIRQPSLNQFGNAMMQAGAEVVGGTIEGIGYLGEVGNIASIVSGTETEFGNALSDFGKSIKESSREAFPIYQDYGEGFHPGNFSWWMTNAPSIASSLSLMIPSGMATGMVSTLAKSTGLMAKLGAKGGAIAKSATQAVFSRHMENMMEASQSYDEIYDKNIRNGLTVDDAKQNAAIGAASVYNRNWAMLAQDIPQYILLGRGLKGIKALSATGDEIAEGAVKTGRSLIAAKAKPSLNLLKNALGEGGEESYQFVVQKEADYLAQRELDPNIEGNFSDRMGEYLKDGDMWTSAWFGAMGATAMQGLSSINNKLTEGRVLAQDVKSWGAETSRMHKTIMTATELENTNLVQAGMDAGLGNMLHRAAVHGNMDKFREYIETVSKEDITDKELSKVGTDRESAALLAKNKDEVIADANRYEQIYNDNVKKIQTKDNKETALYKDQNFAALASRSEFLIEKFGQRKVEKESEVEDIKSKIAKFGDLSPNGQQILEKKISVDALKLNVKQWQKALNSTENEGLKHSMNLSIESVNQLIKEEEDEIKELEESRTPEEKKKDKGINTKSKATAELSKVKASLGSIEASIADHQDILDKLQKGEMPFPNDKEPDTNDDDLEEDITKPNVDDTVVYTNPKTKKQFMGWVTKIENEGDYTIQVFDDDTGASVGTPIKVSRESLERHSDSTTPIDSNVEPSDISGIFQSDENRIADRGLASVAESLQWWYGKGSNEALNKIISDPNLSQEDKDNANITFSVDNSENIVKGTSLRAKNVDKYDESIVDTAKIKVSLKIGEKTFDDIYVHRTDFKNVKPDEDEHAQRIKIRTIRREILKLIQAGKIPVIQGVDNNSQGHPNNVKNYKGDIPKSWNVDSKEVTIGIIDQYGNLNFGSDNIDYREGGQKGMILAKTTKTVNGSPGLIRINPTKVSKEHAEILWDELYNTYKNGYNATPINSKVTGNLTSGDVVRLLIFMGEKQTSVQYPANKGKDFMIQKQMWIGKEEGTTTLFYGHNPKTGNPKKTALLDFHTNQEAKDDFVNWVIENKNYPTYISDDRMGVSGINEVFNKAFTVGSLSHDGKGRYSDMLMNGGLVKTDVQEYIDGTVFSGPVLMFNSKGLTEKAEKIPVKQPKKQSNDVKKPIKEEDAKEKKPEVKPKPAPLSKDAGILPSQRNRRGKALREKQPKQKDWIKQDAKKEIKVVKKMLSKKVSGDVKQVNQLIDVAEQGKKAWATYTHDMIKLWDTAETGSVYHEAFHRVSLGYLTPEERDAIHEEAIRKYGLRGLSTVEVDDELAEKFRLYVMQRESERQGKGLPENVRLFFKRLLSHIRAFFTGPYRLTSPEIDRLFKAIYEGKYRASKVRSDAYQLDGAVLREMYNHDFDQIDTVDQLRETIKTLTFELLDANTISDLNSGEVKNLDWELLRDRIIETTNNIEVLIENDVEVELNKTRLAYWRDILGYDSVSDRYEGFEVMKELVTSFLSSMNIQVRTPEDPDNMSDATESGSTLTIPDKQSFEVSVKENALGTVKLNIALLQTANPNPITGGWQFVDYNDTWNSLLGDLYQLNDIEGMIAKIKEIEEERPGYDLLYDKLIDNKDNLFRPQFFATMDKHKHAFIDAVANFKGGKHLYEFRDSDINSVSRDKVKEWGLNLYKSSAIDTFENEVPKVNEDFITDLKSDYDHLRSLIKRDWKSEDFETRLDDYYTGALTILNKAHINVDKVTIDFMLSDKNKPINEAVAAFITQELGLVVKNVLDNFDPEGDVHALRIYEDSAVNKFGDAYARSHPEQITAMILGPGAAQYYVYANHSVVTSLIRDIKLNPQVAERLMNKRFNMRGRFLNQLANDPTIRKNVSVRTFAGMRRKDSGDEGRDYHGITPEEDYALKLHATANKLVTFPTLADKKTYYFLDGLEVIEVKIDEEGNISEDVVDIFYNHVRDEYDRITEAKKDLKTLSKDRWVENYHFKWKGKKKDSSQGQAIKFTLFKGLSYDNFNENEVRAKLREVLEHHVDAEIKEASMMGLIKWNGEKGIYEKGRLDNNLFDNKTKEYGGGAIRAIFAEFALRTLDNNIELHKMFIGDPAFYEGPKNLSKRLGELIASGEEMSLNVDGWGDSLTRETFKVSTLKTQELVSAYYDNLFDAFLAKMPKSDTMAGKAKNVAAVKKMLKPYRHIQQADGQTFITPDMYRSISIRIGEWSVDKEDAFNILTSGAELSLGWEQKALNVVLNPLKTVYFGFDTQGDIAVPIYDKMSMAPLFRRVVKGLDIEELLDTMEQLGIDMVKMDSATKVGNRGSVEMWADKDQTQMNDLSTIPIFSQQFKNLRRQQVTPVHDSERTNVGTQMIKISMGDLDMNNQSYTFEGKKTGREIGNIINKGLGKLSSYGKEEIDQEYGFKNGKISKKKLVSKLRREAKEANMPLSTIDAIREKDGKLNLEMDSMPNRKWFFSRMIASIAKKVVNRKLPGGQFIQVTNLGYRKSTTKVSYNLENRLEWLNSKEDIPFIHTEDGKVVPMGCVVTINAFKHAIPNYNKLTWVQKVAYVKKQKLDVIGYRIPTQGQNSTVVMRVMGILPEQAGDAIILPSEFTALTGSDFDIDKLFLMRKNYNKDSNGNMQEISFIKNDDDAAYDRMLWYKFGIHKNDLNDEFKDFYRQNGYDKIELTAKKANTSAQYTSKIEYLTNSINATKKSLYAASGAEHDNLRGKLDSLEEDLSALRAEEEDALYDFSDLSNKDKKALDTRVEKELIAEGHLPKRKDFVKLSDLDKNIPKAIENRVINAYISILTSEQHLLKIAAPLGGLTDELKDMANQVREKSQQVDNTMLTFLTPRAQSDTKFKYASGKSGIGPFALHNAHHIITQLVEYKMLGGISNMQNYVETKSKLNNEVIKLLDLSANKGFDGVDILDWLSALIDAHVDMAKDPYIMDLNVNQFTYDIIGYLIRTGIGKEGFVLLANPGVKLASDIFINSRRSIYRSNPMTWNGAIKEAQDIIATKANIEIEDPEGKANLRSFTDRVLDGTNNSIERKWLYSDNDTNYGWNQLAILEKLVEIKKDAQILTNDVQSTQVDTKKFGSSIIGLEAFFNKIRKSISQSDDGETYGYKSIIPYDEEGLVSSKERPNEVFIADYYRNGLVHMMDMFEDITLDTTPVFRDSVRAILAMTNNTDSTDEKVINKAANELYSALMGNFFFADRLGMTTGKVSGLLQGKNSIFFRFDKLKAENPELFETNPILKRLQTYTDASSTVQNYFTLRDTQHKDPMELDDIVYGWEELLSNSNPEIETFGRHLFLYNFYTTGLNQRIYGFTKLVPPSLMKEYQVNGEINSFDAVVKGLISGLKSDQMYTVMGPIINDVLQHTSMVPSLWDIFDKNEKKGFNEIKFSNQGPVYWSTNSKLRLFNANQDGKIICRPYVEINGRYYKYQGYILEKEETPKYVYVEVDSRGNHQRGRFVHEYGLEKPLWETTKLGGKLPANMTDIVKGKWPVASWQSVDVQSSMFDTAFKKDNREQQDLKVRSPQGFSWTRKVGEGYEVSSANDKRFSAFYARLQDGRTIELAWAQAKGYTSEMAAKNKPAKSSGFDYWNTYLRLWRQWANENPSLMSELRILAKDGMLVDRFAKTENNQANALATILNENTTVVPQGTPESGVNNLSTPESPLEIFTDGSGKGSDKTGTMGYGVWMDYNGQSYGISGGEREVDQIKRLFPDTEFDNGIMEVAALSAVLKKFADTGEHLHIWTDSTYAINLPGIWNRSTKSRSPQRMDNPYKKITEISKAFAKRITGYIEQIEANGGSVQIQWLKGHVTPALAEQFPDIYTNSAIYDHLKTGNNNADQAASSVKSKDTFGDLLAMRERVEATKKELGNPSSYTNNSGGALGADSKWDAIGRAFGVTNHVHFWMNNQTPTGNREISKEDESEGQIKVTAAARQMGRIEPTHQVRDERLIRNWSQVKYSDSVVAISTMLSEGDEMNYGKKAKIRQAKGGTGYAVQMAINKGIPVYVFDQVRNEWFKNINGKWSSSEAPSLTQNFAGIGTRGINEDGIHAIFEVYSKTFNEQVDEEQVKNYCKGK